jgi:hypothetical protein
MRTLAIITSLRGLAQSPVPKAAAELPLYGNWW